MTDSHWPMDEFELYRGPQDGAKIRRITEVMPQTIYVAKRNLGDRYAAYGTERCKRFPVCYVMDGYKFVYRLFKE